MRLLIKAGSETAALAVIAGVFGASGSYNSSRQLEIEIDEAHRAPASADLATAVDTLFSDGYVQGAGGSATPVYRASDDASDGSLMTFHFTPPVGTMILLYSGGIAQLPQDLVVNVDGSVTLDVNVDPPSDPVTALYLASGQ